MPKSVLFLALFFFNGLLHAKAYQMGEVWPVREKSMMQLLEERAKGIDMDALKERQRQKARAYLARPYGVKLTRATEHRQFSFVPQTRAHQDITGLNGESIVKAGTRINILDNLPLYTPDLVFFDADDTAQMRFMQHQNHSDSSKWIVVSGAFMNAKKALGVPLYFDQQGKLVSHFGIQHLPARIRREGNALLIDEIAIGEGGYAR